MADLFSQAFTLVLGHEGGFSDDREDPGNWTSGEVGRGECRGTKFGISAAAYPTLDIAGLTERDAQAIYRHDYWERICGDVLPAPLSLLVIDAAINNGVERAVRWLQTAVGAHVDGDLGSQTKACIQMTCKSDGGRSVCIEFQAQRVNFMAALPTWRSFGLGWARRLCTLPYQSLTMGVS
jgi:lysozyme family protein